MSEPQQYKTRFQTVWVIIVCAIVLLVWDIYARNFPAATISEIFLDTAGNHPVLPFLTGVLGGHLFWPQEKA